jgi:branched-chain amino acid transport system permease protein
MQGLTPYLFLALLEGTVSGLVFALTALGLSLVFGIMRIVNVAHGEFYMLGAVIAWYGSTVLGGLWVGLVAAAVGVGALAVVTERLVLRRVEYHPERTIVATIGLLYIVQQVVLIVYGPYARPVAAPVYFRVDFPSFGYSGYKLVVAGIAALLIGATWLLLSRTTLGLYMRATQQDREMAQAFGVPVGRVYTVAFGVGAALAAVAGALVVPIQQAHYLMGLDALLTSFMVVIIGGLGSLGGTLVAGLLIGLVDGGLSVFFSPTLAKIVASIAVALVLVVRTGGLFGSEAA